MEGVLTMVTEQQQPYGAALRVWRVIHFGSREPLADRIDYTTDHIGRVERGDHLPTPKFQRKIFEVCAELGLDVPEGWLKLKTRLEDRGAEANSIYEIEHGSLDDGARGTKNRYEAFQIISGILKDCGHYPVVRIDGITLTESQITEFLRNT